MAIVEARYPDGRLIDLTEVNLTKSGLLIMITDPQGNQVLIHRSAWNGVVKAVQELFEQEERDAQAWIAECDWCYSPMHERNITVSDSTTRQHFIESCTQRDMANGPMPTDELLQRLDIGLSSLKEAIANPNERRLPMVGADCLRGALIRLSQAYSDPQVSARVYELVSITTDIPGL